MRNGKRRRNKDPLLAPQMFVPTYTCDKCSQGEHKYCSRYRGKIKMTCVCADKSHD